MLSKIHYVHLTTVTGKIYLVFKKSKYDTQYIYESCIYDNKKNQQFIINQNNNTENLTYSTCINNLTFKIQDNQYQSNE